MTVIAVTCLLAATPVIPSGVAVQSSIGIGWDTDEWELPPEFLPPFVQQCARLNADHFMISLDWSAANPEIGVYDWSKLDAALAALNGTNLKVHLKVVWAPAWASEGLPAYLPYIAGCSEWSNTSSIIKFASDRDYCAHPPHINPDASREFGKQLALHCGARVSFWTIGNEEGEPIYWPPVAENGDWQAGTDRFFYEVLLPFTSGVRSVLPGAKFAGPEADTGGTIARLLEDERLNGVRVYDVLTIHPYPFDVAPFPSGSVMRMDSELLPPMKNDSREKWVTEIGYDNSLIDQVPSFLQSCIDRNIHYVGFLDWRQFMTDQKLGFTLTPWGESVRGAYSRSKHRAVRKGGDAMKLH